MGIGRRIRTKRKALGLTQKDLAKEIGGRSSQYISQLELDHIAPSLKMLLALSRALGVSTDYLLTGKEIAPLDAAGAIRSEREVSALAKRYLIGLLKELRRADTI